MLSCFLLPGLRLLYSRRERSECPPGPEATVLGRGAALVLPTVGEALHCQQQATKSPALQCRQPRRRLCIFAVRGVLTCCWPRLGLSSRPILACLSASRVQRDDSVCVV